MKDAGLKTKKILRDYFESVLFAAVVALVLRAFFVGTYRVPSYSMFPALAQGDLLFAYKMSYGLRLPGTSHWLLGPYLPKRGEIVVFKCPTEPQASCIKRVVGLPGEQVSIKNNTVFIGAKPMELAGPTVATHDFASAEDYEIMQEQFEGVPHQVMLRRGADPINVAPVSVPPDSIFVLGDSRHNAEDSRNWGAIPLKNVESRAGHIWLSLDWGQDNSASFPTLRWNRLFASVK